MHSITIPYPIELLFAIADTKNIEILWYPFDESPRGRYFLVAGQALIMLSPALQRNPMSLRCALAHELGHHFVGFSDLRADRWARAVLLPDEWLRSRLSWMSPGELAEESGVYQMWVEERLHDLKQGVSLHVSA